MTKDLKWPISSVQTLIKKGKIRGSVFIKPLSDRPRKISDTTVSKIDQDAKKNLQTTSTATQAYLQKSGVAVSRVTISIWTQMGCTVKLPIKNVTEKPKKFWNKVIWSDETKIKIYGHDHKLCVWRANKAYEGKYTIPTVKHGAGYLMFWQWVSYSDTGNLVTLNAVCYQKILEENLHSPARKLLLRLFIGCSRTK